MGVTCQFRPEGVRMNLPSAMSNQPPFDRALADRILEPEHPAAISLALSVSRTAAGATGKGYLFVGSDEADALAFTFANFATAVPLLDIRAGIGTANGTDYRASVRLLDFQIWTPAD
jgi:hypothetical protein